MRTAHSVSPGWLSDHQRTTLQRVTAMYLQALAAGKGEVTYQMFLEFLERFCASYAGAAWPQDDLPSRPTDPHLVAAGNALAERVDRSKAHYARAGFDPGDARNLLQIIELWLDGAIGAPVRYANNRV